MRSSYGNCITEEVTEMPRSFSSAIQSEVAWRAALRPLTEPAIWMAPPNSSSFSVSVVLPASGCEMIAKVRRRAASRETSDMARRARARREAREGAIIRAAAGDARAGKGGQGLSPALTADRRLFGSQAGVPSPRAHHWRCAAGPRVHACGTGSSPAACRGSPARRSAGAGRVVKPVLPDRPICWPRAHPLADPDAARLGPAGARTGPCVPSSWRMRTKLARPP